MIAVGLHARQYPVTVILGPYQQFRRQAIRYEKQKVAGS